MSKMYLLLFLLFVAGLHCEEQVGCLSRDYGYGSTVCVCNSQHCDTVPPPPAVGASQYLLYTSNKAGLRFNQQDGAFKDSTPSLNRISVDRDQKYQTIIGWGGTFTDSAGINFAALPQEAQEKLLRSYFSTDGIEYSTCRVPIGGTDFSTRAYSYDDGDVDVELSNFALASDDFDYKIPFIKRAIEITNNNLQLFASAWTAPKWMKTNGEYLGGFLKTEMYQVWVDYHVKFLDSYQQEGISFWGISTGNEPTTAFVPLVVNSVGWTPSTLGYWVKNNFGPTMRSSNHSNIKILYLDDQRTHLPLYADAILIDPTVGEYVDGIAVHWYYDVVTPAALTLSTTHGLLPDKFILYTEACTGTRLLPIALGSWERGEQYSDNIIEDLENWVAGWVDWNMALDTLGGPKYIDPSVDAPIIVNATAGEFYKQPMYYHVGHFSKFVPRGSVRIDTSCDLLANVQALAFQKPDNGIVVIIQNKNNYAVPVSVVDGVRGTAQVQVSARSINTVLYS